MSEIKYKFKNYVYTRFAPFYDKYKGHEFIISHYHPEDDQNEHVWLTCVSDSAINVDGYVDVEDLIEV